MIRMTKIVAIATTALFALGFFSCSNVQDNSALAIPFGMTVADDNAAYLTLSLDDVSVTKTLLPDVQGAVFDSLVLKGTKQDESQKTLGSWESVADMQSASIPLEVGTWTFDLSATSGGSSFCGTLQKEIVSGQNSLLFSLALDDIGSGPGSFSLALSFDGAANAQNVSRVAASLENMDKTIVSGYEPTDIAVFNNSVTFSGSQIAAGTYRVKIRFYASVNGVDAEIASWSELVQIVSGFDSSASRTIESFDELYTITYELNGGSFTTGAFVPETFTRRSNVTLPSLENVLRNDSAYGGTYKALGWYTDENCAAGNEITSVENIAQNITIYAKWPTVYTITYNLNGGGFANGYAPREKFIQSDIVELAEAQNVLRDYYIFNGWYTDENCSAESKITTLENGADNITVYAKWMPQKYTITYNFAYKLIKLTYTVEDDVSLVEPSEDGVSFTEWWFEDAECATQVIKGWKAGERHSDINLYAKSIVVESVDVDSIFAKIKNMKKSGVVKASGTFNAAVIREVNEALKQLYSSKPDILVTLDLSEVQGLSSLESASSSNDSCSFYGCANLKQVVLPSREFYIGAKAFYGCTGLERIILPSGVTHIERNAFEGCVCLKSVTVPDSVTVIGEGAFSGCSSLEEITLPFVGGYTDDETFYSKEVRLFGFIFGKDSYDGGTATEQIYEFRDNTVNVRKQSSVFYIPASLKKVILTNEVVIPPYAFNNCKEITSIVIPETVTDICTCAFYNCLSLDNINIPDSVERLYSSSYIFNGSCIFYCPNATNIKIGKIAEKKGAIPGLFNGNAVKNVSFSESVTKIGDYVFYGARAPLNIQWSSNITSIGNHAFENAAGLINFVIPNCITSIGEYIFSGCPKLKSVTFHSGITKIPSHAFSGCSSLETMTIPDTITSLGDYIFSDCANLQSVTFPNGITKIPYGTFSGCVNFKTVTIPSGLTSIGDKAFLDCSNLTFEDLPSFDNVTEIGWQAFMNCASLRRINIPSGLKRIPGEFCKGCSNLSYINWAKPSAIESIQTSAFENCTALGPSLTFPQSLETIGEKAFKDCTSLETLRFGRAIKSFGPYRFDGCTNLKSAIFEDTTSLWAYRDEHGNLPYYLVSGELPMEDDGKENLIMLKANDEYEYYRK